VPRTHSAASLRPTPFLQNLLAAAPLFSLFHDARHEIDLFLFAHCRGVPQRVEGRKIGKEKLLPAAEPVAEWFVRSMPFETCLELQRLPDD